MSLPRLNVSCGNGAAPVTGAWTPMTISLSVMPVRSPAPPVVPPVASSPVPPPPEPAFSETPLFWPQPAAIRPRSRTRTSALDPRVTRRCTDEPPGRRSGIGGRRRAPATGEQAVGALGVDVRAERPGEDERGEDGERDGEQVAERPVPDDVAGGGTGGLGRP